MRLTTRLDLTYLGLNFGGYLETGSISLLVAESPMYLQTDRRIDRQYPEAILIGVRLTCLEGAADFVLARRIIDMRTGAGAIIPWEWQRHIQYDTLYI